MNDDLRRAVQFWLVLWAAVLLAALAETAGASGPVTWAWFLLGFTLALAAVVWWEGRRHGE